ncbi:enoyl-CoA hydratase-related protein [Amycolatopsis magusensis]|uniref:enoyl-CoA hydratase-related protein n=1 Tax=Amycolatopsis magusensis TaxID=882444 RepID=UPI003C2F3674
MVVSTIGNALDRPSATGVRVVCRPPVVRVTLTGRGAEGHRLGEATVSDLLDAVRRAESTKNARVLVLDALGDLFCTGFPLEEFEGDGWRARISAVHRLLTALIVSPLVTVALVNGAAIGGGVGLAAACDHVVVGYQARFRLTEVLFGLVPALVLPLVVQRVGPAKARSLALLATDVPAGDAVRFGLADQLPDDAERAVRGIVSRVRSTDPLASAALKRYHARLSGRVLTPESTVLSTLSELLGEQSVRSRIARFSRLGGVP